MTLEAAVYSVPQSVEQCLCVRGVGPAALRRPAEREGDDAEFAGRRAAGDGGLCRDLGNLDVEAEPGRARAQQGRIRNNHERGVTGPSRERQAKLRADSGGFTGRDRKWD
jgi:hypothetical protein